jgi:tRNA/tmRNA/rRNA uracil-C5-methylase (TrmA/RlmC/RlmD family)
MEELFNDQSSANSVEVADPQVETQDTGANDSELANQEPVQSAETNAYYADLRRKQELDTFRTQAETYQQQLDRTAKLAGYQSHDELISALDQIEQDQQRQEYEQAGINPDVLNKFLEQHPSVKFANELMQKQQEEQQFQNETQEFFQEFPDVNPDQIPQEAWVLREQKGLSLLDAYLRTTYKSLGQQKEQEAIQKLKGNALTSPGSLGGGDVQHNTNVNSLSTKDFSSLVDQVLRGERRQL